jgi:hypothetical protein
VILGRCRGAGCLTQRQNLGLQAGLRDHPVRPDAGQQLVLADYGAGRFDQHHEQVKGAFPELDPLVVCEQLAAARHYPEAAERDALQYVEGGVRRSSELSQIIEERTRQLEISGFKSFREAVVDENQHISGLMTLPVFGEHAG